MSDEIESSRIADEACDDSTARCDDRISPGVPAPAASSSKVADDADDLASSSMSSENGSVAEQSDRSRLYGILSVAFALVAAVAILAGAGYGAGFIGGSGSGQGDRASMSSQVEQAASQPSDQSQDGAPASSTSSSSAVPDASSSDASASAAAPSQNADEAATSSKEEASATADSTSDAADGAAPASAEPASEAAGSASSEPAAAAPAELIDVPDKTPSSDTVQTDENNKIKVTVSVDSSRIAAYGIDPFSVEQVVELDPGASVYDALCALDLPVSGTSYYVSAINGLAERQGGQGSGWTYSVDGAFPSKSCGKYLLSGGEKVAWIYSTEKEPTLVMK